jgi:hypothetical protein
VLLALVSTVFVSEFLRGPCPRFCSFQYIPFVLITSTLLGTTQAAIYYWAWSCKFMLFFVSIVILVSRHWESCKYLPFIDVEVEVGFATNGQSVCLPCRPRNQISSFLYSFLDSCRFIDVGRPLWREVGSVLFICCWASPAQSFLVWVPRDYKHILWSQYWGSPNLEGEVPLFIFLRNRVACCLINLHNTVWYVI